MATEPKPNHGTITDANGQTRQTHICLREGDTVATSAGTFQKDAAGVFRWVVDHRFTLTF